MKDFYTKVIAPACSLFAVITVPFALLVFAIYGSAEGGATLSALRTAMFFFFALTIALANALVKAPRPAFGLRVLIHAAITGLGFLLFMLLPAELDGSGNFMGMLIYYVVYAIILAIALILRAQNKKHQDQQAEYKSVFKKDSK